MHPLSQQPRPETHRESLCIAELLMPTIYLADCRYTPKFFIVK